jgi:glycine C-acetyltransferase
VTEHALRARIAELEAQVVRLTGSQREEAEWDARSMKDFVEQRDRDLFAKTRSFQAFHSKRKSEHLHWYGMPLESACKNRAIIFDELAGRRREFLMFASNNYLGLANHPRVVEAICDATKAYGATNTGCRLIGGTNVLHKELERRLAALKNREACIVYPSGYSANLGVISALVRSKDAVVVDKLNHMSIVDGCKLSGGVRRIFQHNAMEDLARVLEGARASNDGILIAVDGVFSMHGDICRLPEIVRLAKKYDAKVLVDDAHATGVLGATGAGTAEHFDLKGKVDLELGTMSKTLAGMGGFVCGDADVIEYLRFYSNSYVFAANIPAGVAAGLIAAIDVMESEPERLRTLWKNIKYLKEHLTGAGFDTGETESAILPIVVGDDRRTMEFGRAVRARGLFCQTVVYPGVSVGEARLRVSVTSEHTRADLDQAAEVFVDAARETGVLEASGARRVTRPSSKIVEARA